MKSRTGESTNWAITKGERIGGKCLVYCVVVPHFVKGINSLSKLRVRLEEWHLVNKKICVGMIIIGKGKSALYEIFFFVEKPCGQLSGQATDGLHELTPLTPPPFILLNVFQLKIC